MGIDHRVAFEQRSRGRKHGIDGGLQPQAQAVLPPQMAISHDGALVGQIISNHARLAETSACRAAPPPSPVQQIDPTRREVNAQQRLHHKGRRSSLALGAGASGKQSHELASRHHQILLVEELALARPLALVPYPLSPILIFIMSAMSHFARAEPRLRSSLPSGV